MESPAYSIGRQMYSLEASSFLRSLCVSIDFVTLAGWLASVCVAATNTSSSVMKSEITVEILVSLVAL